MASARKRKDCFTSFLFVLPLLALFLVFFAYPIIYNIVISFYDWNGISVANSSRKNSPLLILSVNAFA